MADNNTSSGIGFFGLLTIVFIVLKLTGFIAWSWWWVLAPIWGPVFVVGVTLLLALAYMTVTQAIRKKRRV